MSRQILVLGAAGRLGVCASEAFRDAGWTVKGLVRPGRKPQVARGVEPIEAVTRDEAVQAARGCDVVLNAFNPHITLWQKNALSLAYGAIAAAEGNGATLLFPGSVWNYGRGMPPVLDESTPMHPTTRKGAMRVEIEQRIKEASDRGMRTIVLRAGDFYGGGLGSWFDLVICKEMSRAAADLSRPARRRCMPGPICRTTPRRWCGLPSGARILPPFETFGFPGHSSTGAELIATIEAVMKSKFHRPHHELVDAQDVRPVAGARPGTVGARISLARAAPGVRRKAQGKRSATLPRRRCRRPSRQACANWATGVEDRPSSTRRAGAAQ